MLARRLTTILPAMTLTQAIETTRIHSVAGLTGDRTTLVTARPCRAPTIPSRTLGGSAGATSRRWGGVVRAPRRALPACTAGVPPPRLGGLAATDREESQKHIISRES
jgi:hypothetical protein